MAQWDGVDRRAQDRRRNDQLDSDDRRKKDRRQKQICFICSSVFEPPSSHQVICPACTLAGMRGNSGPKGGRF